MQLDEARVPPSGMVKKCANCGKALTISARPPGEATPLPGKLPAAPAKATKPLGVGPALAAFDSLPKEDSGLLITESSGLLDTGHPDIVDLPAPKASGAGATRMGLGAPGDVPDLLAPVGPKTRRAPSNTGLELPDLLAPVGPTSRRGGGPDLLTPVGPTSRNAGPDLLTPVGPVPTRGVPDLLTPVGPVPTRGSADLLTPVGPLPTKNVPDLLTPVGPQPTRGVDLPAPKGFFDDIPQAKGPSPGADPFGPQATGGGIELDALDLLPAPQAPPPSAPPSAQTRGAGPPRVTSAIPSIDMAPVLEVPDPPQLDFDQPAPATSGGSISLDNLDLSPGGEGGKSGPGKAQSLSTDALDLGADSSVGPAPDGVITFGKPPPVEEVVARTPKGGAGRAAELDLGEPMAKARKGGSDDLLPDLRKPEAKKADEKPASKVKKEERPALSRRAKMILAAAAGVIVLGGGAGFYVKMRMDAAEQLAKEIQVGLTDARKLMASDEQDHWQKASKAAERVIAKDKKNVDALGLAAQAQYAWAIDTGQKVQERRSAGDKIMQRVVESSLDGGEIDKARGLGLLLDDKPAEAQKTLSGAKASPSRQGRADSDLAMFTGWAALANRDFKTAKGQFEAAIKAQKDRLPALYGLGQAQLALGDAENARKSFEKVLAKRTNHLGAWVGMASLLPKDRLGTREKRFLEIVSSDQTASAHPRDVSRAWTLAGDEALHARRWDDASFRFKKAEDIDRDNIDAVVGRAYALLGVGNELEARKLFEEAVKRSPRHLGGLVGMTRLALAEDNFEQAKGHIQAALDTKIENPEVQLWYGKVMERAPGPTGLDSAIAAYKKSIELDKNNLEPVVALSQVYLKMGRSDEALLILSSVQKDAENDAFLANKLGQAYLAASRQDEAEKWFKKALSLDPQSVDGHANLGMALEKRGDMPGALAEYEAAYKIDPGREDVTIRLAAAYERAKRIGDAERLYLSLVDESTGKVPTIAGRAAAGRFFARRGDPARAGKLGASILAEDPHYPAALFLRGVAALAEGRINDAQKDINDAVSIDPQAQYFHALGRTYELQNQLDDSLAQYTNAIDRDKLYVDPLVDRARVRQLRREWVQALKDLDAAAALDNERADIPLMIGDSYFEIGRKKEAVAPYQLSLSRDDKNAVAHYKIALAFYDLDKPRELVPHMRRALELAKPTDEWIPRAWEILARAQKSLGDKGGACASFKRYWQVAPQNEAARNDVKTELLSCP